MKPSSLSSALLLASAFVAAVGSAGCAAEESEISAAEDDSTAGPLAFSAVAFAVPKGHADSAESELFTSEAEFRAFFGESCGLLCTAPYGGNLPARFAAPAGKSRAFIYVAKPEVAKGRVLVIRSVSRRGKWLDVATCTREGARVSPGAVLGTIDIVAADRMPIWVSSPQEGAGLAPCP